jgi:hypothetical protein
MASNLGAAAFFGQVEVVRFCSSMRRQSIARTTIRMPRRLPIATWKSAPAGARGAGEPTGGFSPLRSRTKRAAEVPAA